MPEQSEKVLNNHKKVVSNRKKGNEQSKTVAKQSEKILSNRKRLPEHSEKAQSNPNKLRANGNKCRNNRQKALSNQKRLPIQSCYNQSSKHRRLPSNKVCAGLRMHCHDCWAYGATVLMLLVPTTWIAINLLCILKQLFDAGSETSNLKRSNKQASQRYLRNSVLKCFVCEMAQN